MIRCCLAVEKYNISVSETNIACALRPELPADADASSASDIHARIRRQRLHFGDAPSIPAYQHTGAAIVDA